MISFETYRKQKKSLAEIELSVVIPCFNEAENTPLLISEIHNELSALGIKYEILIVDDGSSDSTADVLKSLASSDPKLKILSLASNYGHQVALTVGLKSCSGRVAIAMDGDFQHPPKHLKNLYQIWRMTELDVIQTRRRDDSQEKDLLKKFLSKSFYKIMNFIFNCRLIEGGADFRLMGPKALIDIKNSSRTSIFHRGFCAKSKYELGIYNFDVEKRRFGYSKYNLSRQIHLAILGIFEVLNLGDLHPASFTKVSFSIISIDEKAKKSSWPHFIGSRLK